MKIILYGPDFNKSHEIGWRTTMALSEGLTKLGVEHSVRRTKHWRTGGTDRQGRKYSPEEIADVAITNGWIKTYIDGRNKVNRNVVIRAQDRAGKPAWCIERAFLLDREQWSAMSIGGFCSNGGDFRAEGMPPDRWEMMEREYGLELKPWRTDGEHILLCAQVPWDTQVQDGNHLPWLEQTIREIRTHTDRPIIFRGHPKAWRQRDPYGGMSKEALSMVRHDPLNKEPKTPFEEDLQGAHCVVCFNSNVATLATVEGYPVFTGAPCLADAIAFRELRDLEWPDAFFHMIDRQQWLADLCYKQWHIDEFREAKPWVHLMR